MFEKLLREKSKQVLEYLISEEEASLTEITRHLGISKPGASKHLKDLMTLGIIVERKEISAIGIEKFYSVKPFTMMLLFNPKNRAILNISTSSQFSLPLLLSEQLRDDEFKDDITRLLSKIQRLPSTKRPEYVILFGSVAQMQGTWKSDIDIALIAKKWDEKSKRHLHKLTSEISLEAKHQIKPVFINKTDFQKMESGQSLIREIKDTGMIIHGNLFGDDRIWDQMKRYRNITL